MICTWTGLYKASTPGNTWSDLKGILCWMELWKQWNCGIFKLDDDMEIMLSSSNRRSLISMVSSLTDLLRLCYYQELQISFTRPEFTMSQWES